MRADPSVWTPGIGGIVAGVIFGAVLGASMLGTIAGGVSAVLVALGFTVPRHVQDAIREVRSTEREIRRRWVQLTSRLTARVSEDGKVLVDVDGTLANTVLIGAHRIAVAQVSSIPARSAAVRRSERMRAVELCFAAERLESLPIVPTSSELQSAREKLEKLITRNVVEPEALQVVLNAVLASAIKASRSACDGPR